MKREGSYGGFHPGLVVRQAGRHELHKPSDVGLLPTAVAMFYTPVSEKQMGHIQL